MSQAPNRPGKVKTETYFNTLLSPLTRQVTGASRGPEVVASGQAHSRDVDAILPLVLVLQVSHHLQSASRSSSPQTQPTHLPEYVRTSTGRAVPIPTTCSPSGGPGSSAQLGRCRDRGCGSRPCSLPARSSGHPCCGRRTGSHCSPSPRCMGTHAVTKTSVIAWPTWPAGGGGSFTNPFPYCPVDCPVLWVPLCGREQPTSVLSSLGYVSRKMAKPWKLSLLPNTGPRMRKRCSHHGENWGCPLGNLKDKAAPMWVRGRDASY